LSDLSQIDAVVAVGRNDTRERTDHEDEKENRKRDDRELLLSEAAGGLRPGSAARNFGLLVRRRRQDRLHRGILPQARTRNAARSTSKTASVTSPRSSPSACKGSGRSQRAAMRSSSCSEATSAGGRLPVTT